MIPKHLVVDKPAAPAKLKHTRRKNGTRYVYLELGRTYNKAKQYNEPVRIMIGVECESDTTKLYPNDNYFKHVRTASIPIATEHQQDTATYSNAVDTQVDPAALSFAIKTQQDTATYSNAVDTQVDPAALSFAIKTQQDTVIRSSTALPQHDADADAQPNAYDLYQDTASHSNAVAPQQVFADKHDKLYEALAPAPSAASHSRLIHVGPFYVINHVVKEFNIDSMLRKAIKKYEPDDTTLRAEQILDLAAYYIVFQYNKADSYNDYARNHLLFTAHQRIISGPDISKLLPLLTVDMQQDFLSSWNAQFIKCSDVSIGYDSTNHNCQAGDIDIVEDGHVKVNTAEPIYNIAIATSQINSIPLFYETCSGGIPDVSQLEHFIQKLLDYGYKSITLVIDRGEFSTKNLLAIDNAGYNFIIMMSGNKSAVSELIEKDGAKLRGSEDFIINNQSDLRGITVKGAFKSEKLFGKKRYFHLFYSCTKGLSEMQAVDREFASQAEFLRKYQNKVVEVDDTGILENYSLTYDETRKILLSYQVNQAAYKKKLSKCGYFVIVTSKKMSAEEAYAEYKRRDRGEKLFCADKTFLGGSSDSVHSRASLDATIFILFLALIIRSRINDLLKDEMLEIGLREQYFDVPKAIHELDKVEIIQPVVGQPYVQASAINLKAQKILSCFGLDKDTMQQWIKDTCSHTLVSSYDVNGAFAACSPFETTQKEIRDFNSFESTLGINTLEIACLYQSMDNDMDHYA